MTLSKVQRPIRRRFNRENGSVSYLPCVPLLAFEKAPHVINVSSMTEEYLLSIQSNECMYITDNGHIQ